MKRSVLILLSVAAFTPLYALASSHQAPAVKTSLEGAMENATERENEENWCTQHPEECRYRKDDALERENERREQAAREAYCERNPWRCEEGINQRERQKYCQRYPWKCKD